MSLFGDDGFEVTKVILAEPALHAHKLADGKVNWDIVKASGEEPAAGEVSSEEGSSSFSLSIRDFRISDATIRYEDDSTGMRFSTAPLSLRLRGDMSADQTDLDQTDLDLRLTAGAVRLVSGGIPLLSDAEAELDAVIAADGRVDLGAVKEVYPLGEDVALSGLISADVKVSGRMSDVEKARYGQIGASGTFVVEKLGLSMPGLPAVHIRRAAATITPASMTLGEFGVTVGKSDLAANGQLTGYIGYLLRGDKLSGRLYVKSDLLDLNEIMNAMPADEETAGGEAAAQTPAESPAPAQALEVPRNLDLSLKTELQKVLFQKMTIGGITGEMRMADGTLSLSRLRMQLFGGTATASGSYSTASDPQRPALQLSLGLSGASFSKTFDELEMVQKLVPVFAKTGGDYSLSLDMSATLDAQMSPDLQSVNATGEIKSANIRIQNIEAFDALAKALNNDNLRKIEAKDVAIRFAIRDGRIATEPFDLKMGDIRINMSGSTGLDQTIDYTARVALPAGSTGGILQSVNVGIGGTFTSPKITLGVKEAAEQAVKNVVDQQIQKLTGSESLGEEIRKQADNLRAEAAKAGEKLVEAAQAQRTKLIDGAKEKGALAKLAAEKAGDKLVEEARKQADKLAAEADKQIEKLTAKQE